jgi:hypothetical protein
MAKLKLRIPTLETVPEAQRAFYRQMDGGGFILDHETDGGWGIDDLASLRGKLEEKGRDYDRVNGRLQGFKKADGSIFTVEEITALVAQAAKDGELIATLKDKSKTEEQKLQDLVAAAKRPLEAELAKEKTRVERYRTTTHKAERQKVVDKVLGILKPKDEWRGLLAAEIERQVDIREGDDGTLSSVFMDLDSNRPRMSALSGRDGPMDASEFASDSALRKKFGTCLQGDNRKGADITGPADGGNNPPRQTGADVTLPPNYSQKQFEAAYAQARQQGGEVVFSQEGSPTT